MIPTFLVDATNFDDVKDRIIGEIQGADFVGLDTETHDDERHDGLMQYCKYDPVTRKKSASTKLVFDMRRTIMTGFSIYPNKGQIAYYVNLNHADAENRVPWVKAKQLLDALGEKSHWIAHNAAYEITVFKSCYDYPLPRIIDTLQMAVSAFGPDEYSIEEFISAGQGGIKAVTQEIMTKAMYWDTSQAMPDTLSESVGSIIGKQSKAAHSYNGFVNSICYGYGLKKLVKSMFGHTMMTFAQTLGDHAHMGQLTGEETAAYGAEDSYWALRLFYHLLDYMTKNCPLAIPTFFSQENPMVQVYSDIWVNGLKVNTKAVFDRRDIERENMALILKKMKATIRELLPFDVEPHQQLLAAEPWYAKNYQKYRNSIENWAHSKDFVDDEGKGNSYLQCQQVRGPVSNAWALDDGDGLSNGPNLSHYMPVRVLIYDLLNTKILRSEGKVQSDGEARGRLKDRMSKQENKLGEALLSSLTEIAGVEQRMKLYLTPYTQLMDPETGHMYPVVSSMLASRRMAASFPNPMQLAKRGESTYVRGFFEPDYADHVIVSIDWSSIELVEIGEFSADPEFIKAYGQIPHDDLHAGAAADILGVDVPGLTEAFFKDLRNFKTRQDYEDNYGHSMTNYNRLFTDLKGSELDISKAYKYWRTEVGKGANFNYWYSGFLSTIGERMGWDISKTGDATDRYRNRFRVAEEWRVNLIHEGQEKGFVTLPDGHTRVRWEATAMWREYFLQKFQIPRDGDDEHINRYNQVWNFIARKIQGRANNQIVNSVIQGSCATIAKRSILRVNDNIRNFGWTNREARFMLPIHDELVFSVHKDIVPEFITSARNTMITHPDMFKYCKLDASPSVGLTFEPWEPKKAPFGQVEIFEAPKLDFIPESKWNGRLNDDETRGVVDYLFAQRKIYNDQH